METNFLRKLDETNELLARDYATCPPIIRREFLSCAPGLNSLTLTGSGEQLGPVLSQDNIRVMQFNVLAVGLSHNGLGNFSRCPNECLDWNFRKLRLSQEILQYQADVYCFQEVDMFSYLQDVLTPLGFRGVYQSRPSSNCLRYPDNMGPDGCAVFYNTDRFTLVSEHTLTLSEVPDSANQELIILKLRDTRSGRDFIVGTTHLKAKKGFEKRRLEQAEYILKRLAQESSAGDKAKQSTDIPVIFCGDFNADPSEDAYRAFNSHRELGMTSAYCSFLGEEAAYSTWKMRPKAGFTSHAKPEVNASSGNVTKNTADNLKKGCDSDEVTETRQTIDYIWVTQNSCRVKSVLELPSEVMVGPNRLPSWTYPSDHISLVCDLSIGDA